MNRDTFVNFALVGAVRSATAAVAATLNTISYVHCHADLLHPDVSVRRREHEAYFGRSPKRAPEWFRPDEISATQYLDHAVLDRPLRGENAIGVRLTYDAIAAYELHEWIHNRFCAGDFCLVHVVRNPVVCFVSYLQAKAGAVVRKRGDVNTIPAMVSVDRNELVDFVRSTLATRRKIELACSDVYTIPYRDILFRYDKTMEEILEFVEVEQHGLAFNQPYVRMRNRDLPRRVLNYDSLASNLPTECRRFLLDPDLDM